MQQYVQQEHTLENSTSIVRNFTYHQDLENHWLLVIEQELHIEQVDLQIERLLVAIEEAHVMATWGSFNVLVLERQLKVLLGA